jgi:hypothetical protein
VVWWWELVGSFFFWRSGRVVWGMCLSEVEGLLAKVKQDGIYIA